MPRWSRKSGVDPSTLDDEQNETEDDGMRQSRDDEQGEDLNEDEQKIWMKTNKMEIAMNMNIVMTS